MLQGRKSDPISEAYFKQDPSTIKKEYTKHIEDLTLQPSKVVTIESDEVKQLKEQHRKELQTLESTMKQRVSLIEQKLNQLLKEKKEND